MKVCFLKREVDQKCMIIICLFVDVRESKMYVSSGFESIRIW